MANGFAVERQSEVCSRVVLDTSKNASMCYHITTKYLYNSLIRAWIRKTLIETEQINLLAVKSRRVVPTLVIEVPTMRLYMSTADTESRTVLSNDMKYVARLLLSTSPVASLG